MLLIKQKFAKDEKKKFWKKNKKKRNERLTITKQWILR